MFTVHNNAGEQTSEHKTLEQAKKAARQRSEQLVGSRHYVKDEDFVTVYETN